MRRIIQLIERGVNVLFEFLQKMGLKNPYMILYRSSNLILELAKIMLPLRRSLIVTFDLVLVFLLQLSIFCPVLLYYLRININGSNGFLC